MFYLKHLTLIITQFIDSFRLSNNGQLPKWDVFSFFFFPALVSVLLLIFSASDPNINGNLLTAISIYTGFLVSMLIPFLNFIENQENYIKSVTTFENDEARKEHELKKIRINQYRIMYSQVSFALLLCIISVVLLFVFPSLEKNCLSLKFSVGDFEVQIGTIIIFVSKFFIFALCGLNIFALALILISSNVIIYPLLKKMNPPKK